MMHSDQPLAAEVPTLACSTAAYAQKMGDSDLDSQQWGHKLSEKMHRPPGMIVEADRSESMKGIHMHILERWQSHLRLKSMANNEDPLGLPCIEVRFETGGIPDRHSVLPVGKLHIVKYTMSRPHSLAADDKLRIHMPYRTDFDLRQDKVD